MNAAAIQTIWQAIRESERSDDLSFIDTLNRLSQPRPDRPGALDRAPITTAATEPLWVEHDTLPTVTLPLLARP
jgi:hypothetical protein